MSRYAGRRVLVIGMGGLGCPASLALAYAGVREFTIADPDVVELSNLHRQPWYRSSDVGSPKVEVAAERLRDAFPSARVTALPFRVDSERAASLFVEHDVIIDGTDDVESKFLLSQIAVRHRVPLVHGGVIRFEGQAMLIAPEGPCLRCLFEPPTRDETTSCARAGVLGTVAGVIGATQAVLGLAALNGEGNRYGRLIVFDGWKLSERAIAVSRAPDCPICGRLAGDEPCRDALLGAQ